MIRDLLKAARYRMQPDPQPLEWTAELVERFWDGIRSTRLTEFNFSRQAGRAVVLAIEHLLPREGRILDFGAGDGDLLALLLERGFRGAAYEPSSVRKQALERRFSTTRGFEGVVGHEPREFDLVLLVEVIEHILEADLGQTLRRVAALTRRDGLLVVTTPNQEDLALGMCYDPLSNTLFHRWQHVRSLSAESVSALLGRFGFEAIVTHEIELNDALYVPFDPVWGDAQPSNELPSHLTELRANRPCLNGSRNNLVYIGRRVAI
jgi:SAM-dependent methyltransferase